MQKFWNVIQGAIVTGASIGIVLLAVNQALTPKPVIVKESKQVKPLEPAKHDSHKSQTIDIPISGPITSITQSVEIVGGRVVSASVTIEE